MILNVSKIKTEALLLFCKDLIASYKDNDAKLFDVDIEVNEYFNEISNDMFKQIENVTFPTEHYLKNRDHYRIKAVFNAYNFINKELSKHLEKGKVFNPAMLYFSLLALWFKELNKESRSKEFIYFTIYPYANAYDKLLVNMKNEEFKKLNIDMIEIAEKIIYKYDKVSFR